MNPNTEKPIRSDERQIMKGIKETLGNSGSYVVSSAGDIVITEKGKSTLEKQMSDDGFLLQDEVRQSLMECLIKSVQ